LSDLHLAELPILCQEREIHPKYLTAFFGDIVLELEIYPFLESKENGFLELVVILGLDHH